jgi:oligopeptide transport system permease protein
VKLTLLILRRLLRLALILFVLVTATFCLMRLAPGGPFSSERALPPDVEKALTARFGLDQPLHVQYVRTLSGIVRGDFGPSLKHRDLTVREIIAGRLPASLLVGAIALLLAVTTGTAAGVVSALRARRPADYALTALSVLGISLPMFVIGPLLQLIFAMRLQWLPVAGYGSWSMLVLPAVTLSLPFSARVARLTRAGMLEVLSADFIRTARSKGLPESAVVVRHALRSALLPVVSFLGPAAATLITGSVVVERIFNIPGLGREFVEAALNRDYTLVMGTTVLYGALVAVFNMLADVLHGLMDPRART